MGRSQIEGPKIEDCPTFVKVQNLREDDILAGSQCPNWK